MQTATAADPETTGGIDVLYCSEGHLEITFNNRDEAELEKARRTITRMLEQGYAIFVEAGGGKLRRVKRFSAKRCTYIIDDVDEKAGKPVEKEKPVRRSRATAVAPISGG